MKFFRYSIFCLLILVVSLQAQLTTSSTPARSNMSIGLNLGVAKPFCDVQHTGAGLGFEFMYNLELGSKFGLAFALGFQELNDGFTYNSFETNMITGDFKLNYFIVSTASLRPYVFIGLGVHNYQYRKTKNWAIGTLDDERYYDGAFIFGGGLDYFINEKMSLTAFADYRFTTGDMLDGAYSGESNDGYLNTRLGFNYYFGRPQRRRDDLLALQPAEMEEVEPRETTPPERTETFEELVTNIDKMENYEGEMGMEQYIILKSRIDELNYMIQEKDEEIQELRASLDLKNQRISQFESSGQYGTRPYTDNSGFSPVYEQGLRSFYSRNYDQAISTFRQLLNNYSGHKLASNCQYWIGECMFGKGNYSGAAEAFHKVFDFSFSYKKDDATLMLGRCYLKLNDPARARSYFQGVIDDYPNSEYVEKAREWLRRIS
jgi:tol-pal system protein YbgF